jgi:hypothetical protein
VSSDFDNDEVAVANVMEPDSDSVIVAGGTAEYRDKLIKQYHGGSKTLVDRLRQDGLLDNESLLVALIEEIVKETDNLLGNQLIAIENGSVRDASIISAKRSEVIEKAIKAVQSKQAFEKENGIDLDSPQMVVIFKYFMGKVQEVFDSTGAAVEQRDLFFRTLGEHTENWKKEIREEFEILKSR